MENNDDFNQIRTAWEIRTALETEAQKWKGVCIGLIVLIIFVLLASHGFFGYGDPYQ